MIVLAHAAEIAESMTETTLGESPSLQSGGADPETSDRSLRWVTDSSKGLAVMFMH